MKKSIILFVFCLIATTIWAAPRNQQQALTEAKAFLSKRGIAKIEKLSMSFRAPSKHKTSNDASYYVFNMDDDKGFVIVSGDDRMPPILGYSDSGKFDTDNLPEHIKAWMESYADQLQLIENGKATPRPQKTMKAMSFTKRNIAPLLPCNWNQDAPYYNQCPYYGERCVTGCVATAMAQVLYYHRANSINATLKEIPGYTTRTLGLELDAIPANSPIDWDNMIDNYTGNETSVQDNAVASLMKYCGYSVQMDYNISSNGGSGARSEMLPFALINYFGYSNNTTNVYRIDYGADEWDDLIYNELVNKRPVLYCGDSNGGGHQFVIDGYDIDGLFHVNWGWGGSNNGYFLISVLNPGDNSGIGASSTSDGYAFSQMATIGAEPSDVPEEYEFINYMKGSLNYIDGNNISYNIWNISCHKGTFTVKLMAMCEETEEKYLLTTRTLSNVGMGQGLKDFAFTLTPYMLAYSGMPAGTYKLLLVTQMNGDPKEYNLELDNLDEAMIDYNGSSFMLYIRYYGESLRASSIAAGDIVYTPYLDTPYTAPVYITVNNEGTHDYYGQLYLFSSTTQNKGDAAAKGNIVIKTGGSATTTIDMDVASNGGTYNIWVSTDSYGNNIIGTSTVNVQPYSATVQPTPTYTGITVNNIATGKNVYGNILDGYFNVENTSDSPYSIDLSVQLWYVEGNYIYRGTVQTGNYDIPAGETFAVPFHFSGLEYNKLYYLFVSSGSSTSYIAQEGGYKCIPAIKVFNTNGVEMYAPTTSFTVPENALAVDMSATTSVNHVTPNNNPNTLYYLSNTGSVPAGISSNVIIGDRSESITLSDNYSLYVPSTFTAETISYSRRMEHSTNGTGGWETIVLPFDVDKVVVAESNKQIDWFHSKTDSGKDFWVKSYTQQADNGTVYFDYASHMEAYIPYIIAVPGNRWGEEWNLHGKTLNFIGENAVVNADKRAITTADIFGFKGIFHSNTLNNIYNLDDAGSNFGLVSDATVPAFRAYFFNRQDGSNGPAYLRIAQQDDKPTDETTALTFQMVQEDSSNVIYDLQGRRIDMSFSSLPKGIYIINGKKIVKN